MIHLKYLDLRDCHGLTETPNFGDIPNLETLNLMGCRNLEVVHRSLGHCRMLTSLDLWNCGKLKKLPNFFIMGWLQTLNLLGCESLQTFPKICGDMRRLSILSVGSPWIRSLPPSFSGLINLELIDCGDLESIPGTFENVNYLNIRGCSKLATLPILLE
ncbi:hypothetical protein BC332_33040 [Capsicum chinense]|nr:hypothetical protein BC332_33040 [Capsicum chinense]